MKTRFKTDVWKTQEDATAPLTSDQVYAMVGRTLFALHQLEGLLKIAAGVLKESAKPSEGEIDAEESIWTLRRATLGKIISDVRKVVNVEPGFSATMTRLIRRRNALAHNLAAHTPFHPRNKRWLFNVSRFLWALQNDLHATHYVFSRYLEALLLQHAEHPDFVSAEQEVSALMRLKPDRTE